MDRGFELMIPRATETKEVKKDYVFKINFNFIGREFDLSFSIKSNKE